MSKLAAIYGTTTDRVDDWRQRAACVDVDPEVFFPPDNKKSSREMAIRVCAGCPVRAECWREAVDTGERYGIRAGVWLETRRNKARAIKSEWPTKTAHGTHQGYEAHRIRGQEACELCRTAHTEYRRQRRAQAS